MTIRFLLTFLFDCENTVESNEIKYSDNTYVYKERFGRGKN